MMVGCSESAPTGGAASDDDALLIAKYGKPLAELPEVKLVLISPHNTDIENEYEEAFSRTIALEYGERVGLEWRDVGGGASSILNHLRNVYENSDRSGIDIVWGGGDFNFDAHGGGRHSAADAACRRRAENIPGDRSAA